MLLARTLAVLWLAAALPAAAQTTVYNQSPLIPNPGPFSTWASYFNDGPSPQGYRYVTYDNFILTATAAISTVTWQGFTYDNNTLKATTVLPDDFELNFYTDANGRPGAYQGGAIVPYSQASVGSVDFFGTGSRETIYNYRATMQSPFTATAGTPYWISVVSDMPLPAAWTWTSSSTLTGTSYQQDYVGTSTGIRNQDRTFSLITAPAPEPSPLAALAVGVVGISLLTRRARKRPA